MKLLVTQHSLSSCYLLSHSTQHRVLERSLYLLLKVSHPNRTSDTFSFVLHLRVFFCHGFNVLRAWYFTGKKETRVRIYNEL